MIESIILKNTATEVEILMDMTTTDYVLISADFGTIKGMHHAYKYIRQIGSSVTSTSLETRDVKIIGYVIGIDNTDILQKKSVLNKMINPQQSIDVYVGKYKIQMLPTDTIRYSINKDENNEVMCKFQIEGFCQNPLFEDSEEHSILAIGTEPRFMFPLTIPGVDGIIDNKGIVMGVRQQSLITSVDNIGSINTGLKIIFIAKGILTNPKIINVNTQEYFKINKTMQDGEKIIINTEVGKKKIVGYLNSEEYNYSMYKDLDSAWLQLSIGDNVFGYSADTNLDLLEVQLNFSNKFLEVQ